MITFIIENWQLLLTSISIPIAWIFGGKQKANVSLKKENADATITIQGMYETFALQYKQQYESVLLEVEGLRKHVADLDLRNAITIEASQTWEKKFNDLQKEHDALKKAFDILKKSIK